MQNSYVRVNLAPYSKEIEESAISVKLITNQKSGTSSDLPKSLYRSIEKSFETGKTEMFSYYSDQVSLVVILPNLELENCRVAGAKLYSILKEEEVKEAKLEVVGDITTEQYQTIIEGALLSGYEFDKYKTEKTAYQLTIFADTLWLEKEKIDELNTLIQAISLTKNLVNEPVNYLDAIKFSEIALEVGKKFGFATEILNKKEIEQLRMGGLLAVNKGSQTPPTFNIFEYKPENSINTNPLVLVGKGVMFDTGGYSLKTGGYMSSMKSDMAGGAAVLGVMAAVAGNNLPYHIIGLVPATDNMISANALVVDDVIRMMDGSTVEVQNTDAEGRLVLADALTYAKKFNPEFVIDIATLTGASAAITGSFGISILGNSEDKIIELSKVGNQVYERVIPLPLWKEYKDLLKSDIADLKNIGGPVGGVSTAAKFLEHFTDYPWVHLDIAGAAFIDKNKDYKQAGATAVPVRLLYQWIKQEIQKHTN